jgi:hypothetical protein
MCIRFFSFSRLIFSSILLLLFLHEKTSGQDNIQTDASQKIVPINAPGATATSSPLSLLTFLEKGDLYSETVMGSMSIREGHKLQGRLLFEATINDKQSLFLADFSENKVLQIPNCKGKSTYPAFAPNGYEYAFLCEQSDKRNILIGNIVKDTIVSFSTEESCQIKHLSISGLSWSHDGSALFFSGADANDIVNIYSAKVDYEEKLVNRDAVPGKETKSNQESIQPTATSQPGTYEQAPQIFRSPVMKNCRQITHFEGRNYSPSYSKLLNKVAYTTDRFWPGSDICTIDTKQNKESCFLSGSPSYGQPSFSFSGDQIVYTTGDANQSNIKQYNLKTAETKAISGLKGKQYDPVWGKEDKSVLFTADPEKSGVFTVFRSLLNGEEPAKVIEAKYSIRHISLSPIGKKDIEMLKLKEIDPLLEVVPLTPDPKYTPPYIKN